jgi:DNA-binding transcriptional ArsR family regulator
MAGRRLDAKRLGALAHPLRVQILVTAESEVVSPSDLAVALGEPLGVVAYHFRVLRAAGMIELVSTERRRGSIQSFYRATEHGWSDLAAALETMVGPERGAGYQSQESGAVPTGSKQSASP